MRHPSSLMLTCPYDTSSCLYLYISQALWVAGSPRLDFLYPTVTEPIELVANSLSVCRLLVFSRILQNPLVLTRLCLCPKPLELPSHSNVAKVEPLTLLLILRSYLRPPLDLSLSNRTPVLVSITHGTRPSTQVG